MGKLQNTFKKQLVDLSKELDKDPQDITRAEYNYMPKALSDWELRKLGGFQALKNLFFTEEKDYKFDQESKTIKSFKNKLAAEYGKEAFLTDEVVKSIKEMLEKHPIKIHKPVKVEKSTVKTTRTLIAHLSDLHYGCVVDNDEMAGVNEWNWTVASRRTAGLVESIINYKKHYRNETDLVLCLNGDIIAGIIHNQEWFAEPIATQVCGTMDVLSQAISLLAREFKKITVVCTTGNHGRTIHKMEKSRASTHKWDSFETIIYRGLQLVFKQSKVVEFIIPVSPYGIFDAQGHKFFVTHGDTVFNVGSPGKALNMRSIDTQITKLNVDLLKNGEELAGVLVGHVHTPTMQLTDSGATLFINGCLIGNDPFAQSIGLHRSQPAQWIFEVTKKDAVGDQRLIKLARHDKRTELDKLIVPFKGRF